jgi:Na+-driven multidrug efflux pump
VGASLALQSTSVHLSFLIITAIINTMGLIASAAVGVTEKIMAFAFLPPDAFAAAVAAMTAQNIGAGKPERALQSLKWSIVFSLVFGLLVCGFANLFPEVLPAIFTTDGAVIRAAGLYMRTYSVDCILVAFVFSFNNYFSGCGNAMISMIHNVIATFAVRIPVTLVMSRLPDASLLHMGLAAPAASLLSIFICAGYFLWLRKKTKIPA